MNATTRVVLIGFAVALVLVLVLGPMLFMAGMMGRSGAMVGPGWSMLLPMLLIIVGLVLLLAWGASQLRSPQNGARDETPLTILKRRYARGEIGREEYERIEADLRGDGDVQ